MLCLCLSLYVNLKRAIEKMKRDRDGERTRMMYGWSKAEIYRGGPSRDIYQMSTDGSTGVMAAKSNGCHKMTTTMERPQVNLL